MVASQLNFATQPNPVTMRNRGILLLCVVAFCAATVAATSSTFSPSDIKFKLYTRANPTEPQLLTDLKSILLSHFNPRHPTRFDIHGWTYKNPALNLKNEYLKKGNFNVIFVDWTALVSRPYPEVALDVPFVGKVTAQLIWKMLLLGTNPKEIIVTGDKLGAHVAGFTGKSLKSVGIRIGTIIGFDTALPSYVDVQPAQRLNKGDADYVVAIHTNAGGNGLKVALGDLDLYPYSGLTQPYCDPTVNVCSHERAYQYFAYYISAGGGFPAKPCGSVDELVNCGNSATTGIVVPAEPLNRNIRGIYYAEVAQDFFDQYVI